MLKIGIIGCGNISNVHIPIARSAENAKLIALCDINIEKIHTTGNEKKYTDYKQMIDNENLDIVHICTPHFLHKEMIIYALSHNVNVLCEKPVVMNNSEVMEVKEVASKTQAKLGIVFQNRLNNTSVAMKKFIDEKTLGDIKGVRAFINWHRDEMYYTQSNWRGKFSTEGGGLLINQAIHTIDLMEYLVGDVKSVQGHLWTRLLNDFIEVETTGDVLLEFENGATGLFYGTTEYYTDRPIQIEIGFDKGTLLFINDKLYLQQNGVEKLICADNDEDNLSKKCYGNSHQTLIRNFYDDIENGEENFIDINEGSKVIYLLDTIRKSDKDKKRVYLK